MASLVDDLKRKSRSRRDRQAGLASAAPARRPRNDLLPRLELVERPIETLRPPARNVRPPKPEHVREVAASIATLGFCAPVLIDRRPSHAGRTQVASHRREPARREGKLGPGRASPPPRARSAAD